MNDGVSVSITSYLGQGGDVAIPAELGGKNVTAIGTKMKVTSQQPLPWTLEGVFGGDPAVAEIENLTHAVTIVYGR